MMWKQALWENIVLTNWEVSDSGLVRSWFLAVEPRLIQGWVDEKLYTRFSHPLTKKHTVKLHQIVARTFIGPRPPGLLILHSDGNPLNNSVSNLRYGTCGENHQDRESHGRTAAGESHGMSKLTAAQVAEIRNSYQAEVKGRLTRKELGLPTHKELGNRYGVTATMIGYIVREKNWSTPQ